MTELVIPDPPESFLQKEAQKWRAWTEATLRAVVREVNRAASAELAGNKTSAATIAALSRVISEAIGAVQIDADQVISGVLATARIPNLDASILNSGTMTRPVDTTTVGGEIYADNVTFNITTARVANWARTSDGFIATATSSRDLKTNIEPADIDPLAVLSLEPKHYQWIVELRKRDDPTYEGYVGPDYHVALEVGLLAQELHERGLWQFVVYERDEHDALVLTDSGEVKPVSIHYTLLPLANLAVERYLFQLVTGGFEYQEYLEKRIDEQEDRIAKLEALLLPPTD